MVRYIIALIIALMLFTTAGCGSRVAEADPQESAGKTLYDSEADSVSGYEAARANGLKLNPDGQEFMLESEGIYMMLPSSAWQKSSEENGCIGFSDGKNCINIYYTDDDGSTYKNVPKKKSDIIKILNDADISGDQIEILSFDSTDKDKAKIYSYTIKFMIPDNNGNIAEFYSVSKSICTKDKVYVVVGQIYDEENVSLCETAEETFTVF